MSHNGVYHAHIAAEMSSEMEKFCNDNNLPHWSADELIFQPEAKPHRLWLANFLRRWFEFVEENDGEMAFWEDYETSLKNKT